MTNQTHTPVLLEEVFRIFQPQPGNSLLDATLGLGGHAKAYLQAAKATSVLGLEIDKKALDHARQELAEYQERVRLELISYAYLEKAAGTSRFTHVLFDLGVGTHQLDDDTRGISFRSSGPLTMRFTGIESAANVELPSSNVQAVAWLESRLGRPPEAQDLLARLSEEELADIIWRFGEERYSRRIARAVKQAPPVQTAKQLAELVSSAVPKGYERGRIHPATRTFQAIRMVVNRELESLQLGLEGAIRVLQPEGRLVVISFHSLEDRLVKQFFRSSEGVDVITKKPLVASPEEIARNPRSRSAKLRALEIVQ